MLRDLGYNIINNANTAVHINNSGHKSHAQYYEEESIKLVENAE